jgi:hypothetical protein
MLNGPLIEFTDTTQVNWFSHEQLKGSAARYLPKDYDVELADKLYAVDFYPEGYCTQPEYASNWCVEYKESSIRPHENFKNITNASSKLPPAVVIPATGERIYSIDTTHTGPDVNEIIFSQFIGFDLKCTCALQYQSFLCRADGMIGTGLPCDDTCGDTCSYVMWGDGPFGSSLLSLLECNQDDNLQFQCDGDKFSIIVYDNCKDLNCEIQAQYPPETGFCTPMSIAIEGCVADSSTNPTYLDCASSSSSSTASASTSLSTQALDERIREKTERSLQFVRYQILTEMKKAKTKVFKARE